MREIGTRGWLFALLCVASIGLSAAYTWTSVASAPTLAPTSLPPATTGPRPPQPAGEPSFATVPEPARRHTKPAAASTHEPAAYLLVRHTALDQSYGALAIDSLDGESPRTATALHCDRVHFAAGRGVCLEAERGAVTTYAAVLFDSAFHVSARIPLAGPPSRTRVSPDGRLGATTVFLFGHSYVPTQFSTETRIFDAVTGAPVVNNLEQMEVWLDGARIQPADANFWGVTFAAGSNEFYATLGTGGHTYLVKGDIRANRVDVIRDGVECPSLSPDNTRIAFKKRVPGPGLAQWRLYVLDVATLAESPVAENRFIDEQVEWLDAAHILYTQPDATGHSAATNDVWMVAADGSGEPALLLREADTPTVMHPGKNALTP